MQQYTLQDLATAADMTVRNVRSYQTRGLIPPPARQGRRSIYTREHLDRLVQIRQARARGASLALIGTRLARGGSLDAEGLDSAWLPRRAPGNGSGRSGRSRPSRVASLDGLLTGASSAVEGTVQDLVEAGVLQRSGHRVVAERSLATAVANLAKRGLPVERALALLAAAADAGRALGAAVEATLMETQGAERARAEMLDLVAGVLDIVITIDVAGAERRADERVVLPTAER